MKGFFQAEGVKKGSVQPRVACFRQGHFSLEDGRGLSGRFPPSANQEIPDQLVEIAFLGGTDLQLG